MMTSTATIAWHRQGAGFLDNRYSRSHQWSFDGGQQLQASASPEIVPVPLSDPAGVDPEEAFVASLSSCHMLWFLSLAARQKLIVDDYVDHAVGEMAQNSEGKLAMTKVTLRPKVTFAPGHELEEHELEALHERAHQACFLANSVKTRVLCEPQ